MRISITLRYNLLHTLHSFPLIKLYLVTLKENNSLSTYTYLQNKLSSLLPTYTRKKNQSIQQDVATYVFNKSAYPVAYDFS